MMYLRLFILLAMSALTIPSVYGIDVEVKADNKKTAESSPANCSRAHLLKDLMVHLIKESALKVFFRPRLGGTAQNPQKIQWNCDESYTVRSSSLTVTFQRNQCIVKTRSTIVYVDLSLYEVDLHRYSGKAVIAPKEKLLAQCIKSDK